MAILLMGRRNKDRAEEKAPLLYQHEELLNFLSDACVAKAPLLPPGRW